MTIDRDPMLQRLFAEAQEDLADDDFAAGVMAKVDQARKASLMRRACVALLLAIGVWFASEPIQQAAGLVVLGLAQPIIEPGSGFAAWLFSPINSFTGLSALVLLALGAAYRKLFLS